MNNDAPVCLRARPLDFGQEFAYYPSMNSTANRLPPLTLGPRLVLISALLLAESGPAIAADARASSAPVSTVAGSSGIPVQTAKRFTYTPRPYPVDERGFSPVDKALAKAFAREDMVAEVAEGALNPYVLKVISAYP